MTVICDQCGKAITRSRPRDHNFCCVECRNRWNSQHVDYAALSRGHRAQHLTELNKERNPHCRVAKRGKYDLTRHPNYKYTADADPKNVFDMERYMKKQRAVVKPDDRFDVYEIDVTT